MNQAQINLATAAAKKKLQKDIQDTNLLIRGMLPASATADVVIQWFEDDEVNYRQYPKYALYTGKECLSPWFYTTDQLVQWVSSYTDLICDLFNIKDWIQKQRISSVNKILGLEQFELLWREIKEDIKDSAWKQARMKLKTLIYIHQITVEACKEALISRGSNVYPSANEVYYTDAAQHLETMMMEEWEINRGS